MSHLAVVFGFIGRLYAIRSAVDYTLVDFKDKACDVTLWHANMRAWKLAVGLS